MTDIIKLKPRADFRILRGHPWVFSNEIHADRNPLTQYQPGQEVRVEAHNGRFLGMGYINPHSLISIRLFSSEPNASLNEAFFVEKLQQALAFREKRFKQPYYRLVYSEADSLPGLVIDRFADHLVCQLNTAGIDSRRSELAAALKTVLPSVKSVLMRNDAPTREQEGLDRFVEPLYGEPPQDVPLEENGVRFIAPIWHGQKTGWFYDQRLNREQLKNYVQGKRILDVFSYLGAFAIEALAFGAAHASSIDASSLSKHYILHNAKLNQVDPNIEVYTEDAFTMLKQLRGEKFDVIIVDPPAFIKKAKDKKAGQIAYQRINELALRLLAPQGVLTSCSCSMHLSFPEFHQLLMKAATKTQSKIQLISQGVQSPDHPILLPLMEMNYLKAFTLRKIE